MPRILAVDLDPSDDRHTGCSDGSRRYHRVVVERIPLALNRIGRHFRGEAVDVDGDGDVVGDDGVDVGADAGVDMDEGGDDDVNGDEDDGAAEDDVEDVDAGGDIDDDEDDVLTP